MFKSYIGHGDNYYSTIDGKRFVFTVGDETSKAEARERAEQHDRHRQRTIEEKLGRELTQGEYLRNRLNRVDDRTQLQKRKDRDFSPVRKAPGRYDSQKAEIQRKIIERDVSKMPTLERQLWDIEQLEAAEADKAAVVKAREDHLKKPRVAKALSELNGVLKSMEWDDSRTVSEVAKVEQAIQQWQCVDGCPETATSMLKSVLDYEDQRDAAMDAEKREQIKAIEGTLARARSGEPLPKVEINRNQSLEGQIIDLQVAMFGGLYPFDEYDSVYQAGLALKDGNEAPALEAINKFALPESQTLAAE